MTRHPRLGFCGKYVPPDGDPATARAMNVANVTMAGLARLGAAGAFDKVAAVAAHNLAALARQIAHVATRPPLERLFRIVSGVLPAYNHATYGAFYRDADLAALVERGLGEAGALARAAGVRLSMHPSQFCVVASVSESAVENGVAELAYHADVMQMLGYGGGWHPEGAHVNIHGGGRATGVEGLRAGLGRLPEAVRNLVTVENDEISYGFDDLLPLAEAVPIVLDLHHHWVFSRGDYVQPDDPRLARVVESWRGVRPIAHVSAPREDLVGTAPPPLDPAVLPDYAGLLAAGVKPRDLRAHSEMMWNRALNALVGGHLAWADFEVEAKAKNLASEQLARQLAGVSPSAGEAPLFSRALVL